MSADRIIQADVLRIISIVSVDVLHTPLVILCNFGKVPPSWWQAANLSQSVVRFSVPLFIMLSGAMILGDAKNRSIRHVLTRRIPRIGFPLLVFSVLYLVVKLPPNTPFTFRLVIEWLAAILNGPVYYHLWYLYMLIGLYLMTPAICTFVSYASFRLILYVLVLWAVFALIQPYAARFFQYRIPHAPPELAGYAGYYLLGYFLYRQPIRLTPGRVILILCGIALAVVLTARGTFILTRQGNQLDQFFYEYLTLHVAVVAAGIFILVRNMACAGIARRAGMQKWLEMLSNTSFGVYLIHILVLEVLSNRFHIHSSMTHPALAIPFTALAAYCLSVAITALLQKLPFHRYIV